MQRYPFSPELLDALPEELVELFRGLELTLLREICSRLKIADNLNEVTVQDIRALRSHGISLKEIEKAIRDVTGKSVDGLNKLMDDVVARNQEYYTELIDFADITAPKKLVDVEDTWAIYEQTRGRLRNITQSMGFLVDHGRTMLPPAKAYQWSLDSAELQVQSGAISYNEAIRNAVRQLADSGLKTVAYESGRVDSVDVAVRRAVMTGVNQLNQKYREQSMDYLETDLVEVSAHRGARDIDGPNGWENHKKWQGKVYRWKEKPKTSDGDYPDFEDTCGYGDVTGIGGANCRHSFFAFIEGVMERTYTDEQLANIDTPPFEYQGRTYTAYQATQKQRQIERTIRKLKREKAAFEAAGLKEDATDTSIRIRRLSQEYKNFSKSAGLTLQNERMRVLYPEIRIRPFGDKTPPKIALPSIKIPKNTGTTQNIHEVGKIEIEKFNAISEKIKTDEVIITEERIKHIKDRHPNDYERYSQYISKMVENPQYILEDKSPNTAVILQEFADADERFRLILKLAVEADDPSKKNSIITFLKISKKTFEKYIRNKKILYKSE